MSVAARIAATCALALALPAAPAAAHPLGNFSLNHLTRVSVSSDRVDVRYMLDQAEVPTFQERGLSDAAIIARKRAEVLGNLEVSVDGREVALRVLTGERLSHPRGQGGLPTTRFELALSAPVSEPRRVVVRDGTFAGRVGWKAVVAVPGTGTAVRSSVAVDDPTNGLRSYPQALLESPREITAATLSVRPGAGTLSAPGESGKGGAGGSPAGSDGFARVFADAAAGQGGLLFLLASAFAWGALHALSPGHGKAMVAAYLVGTRGTARHAVALGAVVTVTHTIGVFALGLVTLALAEHVVPEVLYPWLTLVSGLLVVVIGAGVLRLRVRSWRGARPRAAVKRRRAQMTARLVAHDHDHPHPHDHDHSHLHAHPHDHDGGHHGHSHGPSDLSWRGVLAMGGAAGLIPCPSALVVLLAAVAQHQVALGMVLIVAFSFGLAATLTLLGLVVVRSVGSSRALPLPARLMAALPAVSAVIVIVAGCLLTLDAVPRIT